MKPVNMENFYDPRRSSVAVAAAGTGKTWRLVRRYLAIVATRNPDTGDFWARPAEAVAVTFTRAAAAEMRERVRAALLEAREGRWDKDDPVLPRIAADCKEQDFERLLAELAAAPIDTIHGLCARLLAEFPELSGVAPDSRPLDPAEDAVFSREHAGRFLDACLDDLSSPLREDCRALLAEHSLDAVKAGLLAAMGDAAPTEDGWQSTKGVAETRSKFIDARWESVMRAILPVVRETLSAVEDGIEAEAANTRRKSSAVLDQLREHGEVLDRLRDALDAGDRAAIFGSVETVQKRSFTEAKGKLGEKPAAAVKALKTAIKQSTLVRGVPALPPPSDDPAHVERIARWARLGLAAREDYQRRLRERGLLRYGDLETRALALLRGPAASRYLGQPGGGGRYKHILVDEYQDTNPRQVDILAALAEALGGPSIFRVGDPKQSIYRFRGADVEVFEQAASDAEKDGRLERILETRRSSPALAAFFNDFFPALFGDGSDGAPVPWEGKVETSRKVDDLPGCPVDLLIRLKSRGDGPGGNGDDGDDSRSEPRRVAAWMDGILRSSTLPDDKESAESGRRRALRPGDVAILLPRWTKAEAFREALEARGIAAQVAGGRGLLGLPEVRDLINLIRFWASPDDHLAAAGVLRGPVFALSDLGLYVLARWPGVLRLDGERSDETWIPWESPGEYPRKRPRPLRAVALRAHLDAGAALAALDEAGCLSGRDRDEPLARLKADAESLESNRNLLAALTRRAGSAPTADLLADAIAAFRLEACWIASPRGRRAAANAWRFVETVRGLEAEGPDLARLCAWLDSEGDPTPEGLIAAGEDAVTIGTIHSAKGREWPVVVIADLAAKGGAWGGAPWTASQVPLNPGQSERTTLPRADVPAGGFLVQDDPLAGSCEAMELGLDARETKRLLYVAMTRAKDRLAISGDFNKTPMKSLADCSRLHHYVDCVFGLVREDEDEDDVLRLPEGSRFRSSVRVVEDWDLPAASIRTVPVESSTGSSPQQPAADESVLAWRAQDQVRTWNPSSGKLPEEWETELGELRAAPAEPQPASAAPPFPPPEGFEPRALGTIFHAAVEDWAFHGFAPDRAACARMAERHVPGQGDQLAPWLADALTCLAGSALGQEVARAAARKESFHEVDLDVLIDGSHRIQGRIDLLFKDDEGEWCVVDFKLASRADARGKADYTRQLAAYRKAVEAWRPGEPLGGFWIWEVSMVFV